MTELQRQQHAARLRTLETLRIVIENGAVRFVPHVYGSRSLHVDKRLGWDRLGHRDTR